MAAKRQTGSTMTASDRDATRDTWNLITFVAIGAIVGLALGIGVSWLLYQATIWAQEPAGITPERLSSMREGFVMASVVFGPMGGLGGALAGQTLYERVPDQEGSDV